MYIFGKNVKIVSMSETPVFLQRSSQTPALLLPSTFTTLSNFFLALNAFYFTKKEQNYYSKCSAFASFELLQLFFTSNPVAFVDGGARMFLSCPKAQGTPATPLAIKLLL